MVQARCDSAPSLGENNILLQDVRAHLSAEVRVVMEFV